MGTKDKKFQKLTPIHDVDMSIYGEAIDYVFNNKELRNIAISGAYCAGKSSVVATYKKQHPMKKFLHLSLSYFEDNILDEEADYVKRENVLEGKILNQLIYQINARKIPQTNFRVKKNESRVGSALGAVGVVACLGLLSYILKFGAWKKFLKSTPQLNKIFSWSTNENWLLVASALIMVALGYGVYFLIQLQKNKGIIKKLNVSGNEIEIFEQKDDSYFDKYLNEILYLLDKVDVDAIVFEDMDRYNINMIFQRLREINGLVNSRRKKKQPPLRFFYLLRDDVFISKDRTKFFDFIIPIVPILDGSNSYDQMISHFEECGILGIFSKHFLQEISLYVDDMRILKNICNEFMIYNARISTTDQDANKLLAMLVYKNLFPRDFSELQLNQGFIALLFKEKEKFIEKKKGELQDEIEKCKVKINTIETEVLSSKEELDALYSSKKYVDYYGRILNQYVQERNERKENIELRASDGIEIIKNKIRQLEHQVVTMENWKLFEIIDRNNIDEIFKTNYVNEIGEKREFSEIKGNEYFDLLKFLIRNGYIDESYPDYMTYFYANSLSETDKKFLRSVTDCKAKEYGYKLKNPQNVMDRLRIVDFENEEILNFDLLHFILVYKEKYNEQLVRTIKQIERNHKTDFFVWFIEKDSEASTLIQAINQHWRGFFFEIQRENKYTVEQAKKIAQLSLVTSTKEELIDVNEGNVLSEFISNTPDFLDMQPLDVSDIIDKMVQIGVRFVDITFSVSDTRLWKEVYKNNLYQLNSTMIGTILENKYGIVRNNEYDSKNYSLICSRPHEHLVSYVEANINEYFKEYLKGTKDVHDDEPIVAKILNNKILEDINKKAYLDILSTRIDSLGEISEKEWQARLLEKGLVKCSLLNVLRYFFNSSEKYDTTLTQFIHNSEMQEWERIDIDEEFGEGSASKFFNATVKNNEMSNSKYEFILRTLGRYYTSFSIEGISDDKIGILIRLRIIRITREVVLFMRENYPNKIIQLIEKNPQNYVEALQQEDVLLEELIQVLNTNIGDGYKIDVLKKTNKTISIQNKNYSEETIKHILIHNFDDADLQYLLQEFEKFSPEIQDIIVSLAEQYIKSIVMCEYYVEYTLMHRVMKVKTISQEDKLAVFSYHVNNYNREQCKSILKDMEEYTYLKVFEGRRPKILITKTSEKILNVFQEKNWISSYSVYTDKYYRAIGRKK